MDVKHLPIWLGTAGGTFLSSMSLLRTEDILVTALLASLGAVVSFLMSCFLNLFLKPKLGKFKKDRKVK